MILNTAPTNEAIVSNVGEIGEFRIRNSAKAFGILSSGLYANKIQSLIRELSCNAVDSHIAAGKDMTPFDVHLPNTLEPWFSIRDYGVGLTHDEVTNIYTTYFESTKTSSNLFTGCLGLGSKSFFAYTDNASITAIKNGRKGVYTAFINEVGVPSIALMMEEDTDEPTGVEVKFAVNDRNDFERFRQEARTVFTHFTLLPVVTGNSNFQFATLDYESKNIIPGVHALRRAGSHSVAIMGNVAYPIDIPRSDATLGDLRSLLNCGLVIHFAIGELDFQPSREGLSYIPRTVESIKKKLEAVTVALTKVLAKEADAIPNLWERALFLNQKRELALWRSAANQYISDTKLPTFDLTHRYGGRPKTFELRVDDMAKNWNIRVQRLGQSSGYKGASFSIGKPQVVQSGPYTANSIPDKHEEWHITVDRNIVFVINDTKTGCQARVRYHYKDEPLTNGSYSRQFLILERADRSKEMDLAAFWAAVHEPPADARTLASTLRKKEVEKVNTDISILRLERRGSRGNYGDSDDMVWRDAGDTSQFPSKDPITGKPAVYYYVPLNGFMMVSTKGYTSGKNIYDDVKAMPGLFNGTIYGVRKKDIDNIKSRSNWVNFEEHIEKTLAGFDTSKLIAGMVLRYLDNKDILDFKNRSLIQKIVDPESPYVKFVTRFIDAAKYDNYGFYKIEGLFKRFLPGSSFDVSVEVGKVQDELNKINARYPMLTMLSSSRIRELDVAAYINMVDQNIKDSQKG